MTISIVARAFNIVTVCILLAFSASWVAMMLLTWYPGSLLLWYINVNTARVFSEAMFLMDGRLGLGVAQVAALFAVLGGAAFVTGRFSHASRFLSAHLAALLVSLPLIKQAVASAADDFGYMVVTSSWNFDQFTQIDAVRLPLIVLAALACIAAHWELLTRAKRETMARSRAVRLLAIR